MKIWINQTKLKTPAHQDIKIMTKPYTEWEKITAITPKTNCINIKTSYKSTINRKTGKSGYYSKKNVQISNKLIKKCSH